HVLKRNIEVALYMEHGIALEGIRHQVRLKPVIFNTPDDVLNDIYKKVGSWRLQAPTTPLRFVAKQTNSGNPGFTVAIANDGERPVKSPFLVLRVNGPFGIDQWGVTGNGDHGLPALPCPPGDPELKFADSGTVIYPGQVLWVTRIEYKGNQYQRP